MTFIPVLIFHKINPWLKEDYSHFKNNDKKCMPIEYYITRPILLTAENLKKI